MYIKVDKARVGGVISEGGKAYILIKRFLFQKSKPAHGTK